MITSALALKRARVGQFLRKVARSIRVRGIPRFLYTFNHQILGSGEGLFELVNGTSLVLDPRDYFQCMMYYGLYSPEIYEVISLIVQPGDQVIDIGAHIGYFSTHMARLVGSTGQVCCFEPDNRAAALLQRSLAANRMSWVKVFPLAISSEKGDIDFHLSPQLGWSTAVGGSHLTGLQTVKSPTDSLDHLLESGAISGKVALMKIDVEGFEMEVLRGASSVLKSLRPVIIMEVNNQMLNKQKTSGRELASLMKANDYSVFVISRKRTLFNRMAAGGGLFPEGPCNVDFDVVCFPNGSDLEDKFMKMSAFEGPR